MFECDLRMRALVDPAHPLVYLLCLHVTPAVKTTSTLPARTACAQVSCTASSLSTSKAVQQLLSMPTNMRAVP